MPENKVEFFGAFICWMFTGFRGKLSSHYSQGSASKQVINFIVGFVSTIVIGVAAAWIRFSYF